MNNALAVIEGDIYGARDAFQAVLTDKSIAFDREANFAIQVLTSNDYALKLATGNRQSVVNAVTNLAAIGLTLNPAKKQAYLVPRDGKICLDVSYMGLIELAIASGSVRWVKAEVVRETDDFVLNGLDKLPTHNFKPFDRNRGTVVGVYCVAKTIDGDYLTDTMNIDEVFEIRDRSSAWRAWVDKKKKCPWVTDEGEMIKKTIVKRASKMWPKTDRLDQAIHHMDSDSSSGFSTTQDDGTDYDSEVESCATISQLEAVWRKRGAEYVAANDREAWKKLKASVSAKKAALEAAVVGG